MTLAACEPPILFLADLAPITSLHGPGYAAPNRLRIRFWADLPHTSLSCHAPEARPHLTPDVVFEASLHFADSVEKKLRSHRDSEVRRCDVFDVGWALMGNANLPHQFVFAFARSTHAILSRSGGELRQPTEAMG